MLKRSGFSRKLPERQPLPAPRPARQTAAISFEVVGQAKPVRKQSTKAAEQHHKAKLVLLGCLVCRRIHGPHDPGAVELHHYRGGGWGKGGYETLMPVCAEHHRGKTGIHGLGTKGFPKHYGFDQQDLLNDALELLQKPAQALVNRAQAAIK